jgi:hypothetical protein
MFCGYLRDRLFKRANLVLSNKQAAEEMDWLIGIGLCARVPALIHVSQIQ